MSNDPLAALRALPPTTLDTDKIEGNLTPEQLALGFKAFEYFIRNPDAYSSQTGRKIVPVSWSVALTGDGGAVTVYKLVVDRGEKKRACLVWLYLMSV